MTKASRTNEGENVPSAPDGASPWEFAHALLFTGHMIDRPGRAHPVFPPGAEKYARMALLDSLAGIQWTQPGTTIGLAGGANGGDVLFHECCEELGIPTRVLLAMPAEEFEAASVAPAGSEWVKRFHALLHKRGLSLQVMPDGNGLGKRATGNVWQRANLWMIEEAIRIAPERAVLALWDGRTGGGPGGTEHFLLAARQHGMRLLPPIQTQTFLARARETCKAD